MATKKALTKGNGLQLDDPADYLSDSESYRYDFPVQAFWQPGHSRTSVELEVFFTRNKMRTILLGIRTADPRYQGKLFEFPCYAESLITFRNKPDQSFFEHTWKIHQCERHGGIILTSYVPDRVNVVRLSILSSMSTIWYDVL